MSRLWTRTLLLCAGVVALVTLAACGDSGPGDTNTDTPSGTLRIAIAGEPESIDPGVASFAVSAAIAKNTFATLLRFDPTTSELHPYVATEVPTKDNGRISDDGLTYTFNLREDAVWEDGEPMTAENFAYALRRIIDPRLGSYYGATFYSAAIAGGSDFSAAVDADETDFAALSDAVAVTAVDRHTLVIQLAEPSTTFGLLLALWPSAAVRQDVIERYGGIANAEWTEPGNHVASGPFRLAQWEHGSSIVLERNPNFWNEDMMPRVEALEFSIIEDENTAYLAYQSGDLDVVPVPLSSLQDVTESGTSELHRVPEVSTYALVFNMTQPPFDRIEARRAFCRSIDRATAVQEIRQGSGFPTTAWLPPSLVPYYDANRGEGLVFDVEAARSDLSVITSVASSSPSADELSDIGVAYADTGGNGVLMEFVQGQWDANLDVKVALQGIDPPSFGETFFSGQFDIAYIGFSQDYHHPENWLLLWTSNGGLNAGGYGNPDFDAAADAALAEEDLDASVPLWQRAEEILVDEDVALCNIFNGERAWIVSPGVTGLELTGADAVAGDFFWWQVSVEN